MKKPLFIDIWIVLAVIVFMSSYIGLTIYEAVKSNNYAVNKWNEYSEINWPRFDKLVSKGVLSEHEYSELIQLEEEILNEKSRMIKSLNDQYRNNNKGEFWILFIGINILFNSVMRFISKNADSTR